MEVSNPVDGHIDRVFSGKSITRVTKAGGAGGSVTMNIELSDGHEYVIAWVDDNGVAIKGEPVLARINGRAALGGIVSGFGVRSV